MESPAKSLRKATLAVIGTIVGAGVFALPALFSRVGFWPGSALFFLLTAIVLATHLLFIDVILAHRERHRIAGHARIELGPIGFTVGAIAYPLQVIGVNAIYIILGGEFLAELAHRVGIGGETFFWQLLFWFGGALTVLLGLVWVSRVEAVAVWILIAVMVLIFLLIVNRLQISQTVHADWSQVLLPFGVFLFSLSGTSVMGEVVDLVQRNRRRAFAAVTIGTLAAAFLSWVFGVSLALAGGGAIGRQASDLISLLPPAWGWTIPLFGFFAVVTSYLTTAQDLKAMLHLDFNIQKFVAWGLALILPLILFFLQRDFLTLIDFVGTILSGVIGILIAFMALHLLRRKGGSHLWATLVPVCILLAYTIGILHKLWYRALV